MMGLERGVLSLVGSGRRCRWKIRGVEDCGNLCLKKQRTEGSGWKGAEDRREGGRTGATADTNICGLA